MTEQEEFEFRLRFEQERAKPEPVNASPLDGMSKMERVAAGAGKAVSDAALGLKQRWDEAAAGLESLIPGASAINRIVGGPTAAQIRDATASKVAESKRLDAPLAGDPFGIGGMVLGGTAAAAPLAAAGPLGMGAAIGYTTPTTGGIEDVIGNTAGGAAMSVLGDKLVKGVARMVKPNSSPEVQALMKAGVKPTVGQALGGNVKRAEDKAISLPFIGDGIVNARNRASQQLTDAVARRALDPVKEAMPKGKVGREAVEYVERTLGGKYDALLPKLTVQKDAVFNQEIGALRGMVRTGSIDPKAAQAFERIISGDLLSKFKGQGALTGQTLKQIESDLGQRARQLAISTDADQRLLGDAIREAQSILRGLVERSNPQHAAELKAINTGWANFKRMERAAAGLGADSGTFSAAQLQNAVKALDKSKDKARFARGQAMMQDLSDPAKSVLGGSVPNSGTADRLMQVGALGAVLAEPMTLAGMTAGRAAYSAPVQNALLAMVAKRPDQAAEIARLLRQAATPAAALGAGSFNALAQ